MARPILIVMDGAEALRRLSMPWSCWTRCWSASRWFGRALPIWGRAAPGDAVGGQLDPALEVVGHDLRRRAMPLTTTKGARPACAIARMAVTASWVHEQEG